MISPSKVLIVGTVSVRIIDIPTYLRNGEFYRNLSEDDQQGIIEIPAGCFHTDGSVVKDVDEFAQLLRTVLFWMIDTIPVGILHYCNQNDCVVWEATVLSMPNATTIPMLINLISVFQAQGSDRIINSINTEVWELIEHVVCNVDPTIDTEGLATKTAAQRGDLRTLKLLHSNGLAWHKDTCSIASGSGYVDCLKYAHDCDAPWSDDVYVAAAGGGHLHCLEYLYEYPSKRSCTQWHTLVCAVAAKVGHLPCLQFAHEHGSPWDQQTTVSAADGGHLHCLQYAHQQGCAWSEHVVYFAARKGHLSCLQYALQHGCAIEDGACTAACMGGYIDCLRVLHQYNAHWDTRTAIEAANSPHVDCLQYLHEHGCPWEARTTRYAARYGRLDCLRYAIEHGCPFETDIVLQALYGLHLSCVKYLIEERNMCVSGDKRLFYTAVLAGELSILQCLLDNGCTYKNCTFVKENEWYHYSHVLNTGRDGMLRCVQYAVERGWKIDYNFITYMYYIDLSNCNEYMLQQGWVTLYNDEYKLVKQTKCVIS